MQRKLGRSRIGCHHSLTSQLAAVSSKLACVREGKRSETRSRSAPPHPLPPPALQVSANETQLRPMFRGLIGMKQLRKIK